ncbi:MAG: ATP-dependent helicase, partial [Hydrogenophaga sp.]|nr:ATP-dependent helicase [Hydrogenophaga sp.]
AVVPGLEPLEVAPVSEAGGGVKGKRPSKKDKLRAAAQNSNNDSQEP